MSHHTHTHALAAHARHHINLRIERWHRRCVYGSAAALLASGCAWLAAHYFLRGQGQFGESVSPIEPWAMKLHGAAAMCMLFFLGSLMNSHIRRALKGRRNLASGWAMITTFLLLIATGFGLYYLAGESDRSVWSALHWIIGIGGGLLFVVHVRLGRAQRLRAAAERA